MNTSRALRSLFVAAVLACAPIMTGCDVDDTTTGDEQDVTAKPGAFETFKGADGKTYFHLLAANNEKVLKSQAYSSLTAAKKGITSVKTNGVDAANYEVLKASNGEYYFNLVAANGEIIGTSETFSSKSAATKSVTAVKKLVALQNRIDAAATGGAKFQTLTGADKKTYFHLRAANGEIVLVSEGYSAKSGALGGIASVRANGSAEENFEVIETGFEGQAFFHLLAENGEIIGSSEIYSSVSNANAAVESLSKLIASEKVADPK